MYTPSIGDHNIEETVEERMLITETLSPSHHIAKIVRKANQIVGMIRRTYEDRSKNNLVPLYKSLVRPHLEYCVQAWRPYLQQDNNIEGVQQRMTKMMREVEEEQYEQRLKKTKLMSLEMRRLRSDLIEVYKIMHNLEGLEREDFFPLCSAGRRGHQYTIISIVASTAENTSSQKGWWTSGTDYQLQPFVQRQLTG